MGDTSWSDDFSHDNFGDGVTSRYTLPLSRRSYSDPFTHIDPFMLRSGLNYTGVSDGVLPVWVDSRAAMPKEYSSIEVGLTARLTGDGGHEISQYIVTFGWGWPNVLPHGLLTDWHGTLDYALFAQMRVANAAGYTYMMGGIAHQADADGNPIRPDWFYTGNMDPLDTTHDGGVVHIDVSRPRSFRVTMTANGLVVLEMGAAPIAGAPGGPPSTQALTVQTNPDYAQTLADMFDAGMIFPFCLVFTDIGNTITLSEWHYNFAPCGKDSGGGANPIPSGLIDIPQLSLGGLVRRQIPEVMGGYPRIAPDVPSIQIPRT